MPEIGGGGIMARCQFMSCPALRAAVELSTQSGGFLRAFEAQERSSLHDLDKVEVGVQLRYNQRD